MPETVHQLPSEIVARVDALTAWCVRLASALRTARWPHANFTPAVVAAAAVNLAGAIVIANLLKAAHNAHCADTTAHLAADATNTIAAAVATDQATANTLLNELKADFNSHIALAASHYGLGGAGGLAAAATVATADSSSEATAVALADALLAAYNRHFNMGVSAPAVVL